MASPALTPRRQAFQERQAVFVRNQVVRFIEDHIGEGALSPASTDAELMQALKDGEHLCDLADVLSAPWATNGLRSSAASAKKAPLTSLGGHRQSIENIQRYVCRASEPGHKRASRRSRTNGRRRAGRRAGGRLAFALCVCMYVCARARARKENVPWCSI